MNSKLRTDLTDWDGINGLRDLEVGQGAIFAIYLVGSSRNRTFCEDQHDLREATSLAPSIQEIVKHDQSITPGCIWSDQVLGRLL
jgi:hypothetical protein